MTKSMYELKSCPITNENQIYLSGLSTGPPGSPTRFADISVFTTIKEWPGTTVLCLTEGAVRKLLKDLQLWLESGVTDLPVAITTIEYIDRSYMLSSQ